MIALSFLNERSIGLFRVAAYSLQVVQLIQLSFKPTRLLSIASCATLLVGNWDGNVKHLCALGVPEGVHVAYVPFDGGNIRVFGWCVMEDSYGEQKTLALFDDTTKNLHLFEII